jgi:N-methylhydantoinase A
MGPAIAGLIAAETGIGRILIPRDPGIFSAHGLLVTDVRHERSLTRVTAMDATSAAELEAVFAELERKALQELVAEGFPSERLITQRQAAMRYRGQSYEVTVDLGSLAQAGHIEDLIARFHAAHARRYGHMAQAEAVEIVNFQVTAIGMMPRPRLERFARAADLQANPRAKRKAYFSGTDAHDVPVWRRDDLCSGMHLESPAIIEEKTSTIVLYPGQHAEVDEYLNIEIGVT